MGIRARHVQGFRDNTHTLQESFVGISVGCSLQGLELLPGHSAVYDPTDRGLLIFPTLPGDDDKTHEVAEEDVGRPLTGDETFYSISGDRVVVASLAVAEPSAKPELAASMVSKNTITHCKGVEAHRMEVWEQKQKETEGSLAQSAGGTTQSRGSKRPASPEPWTADKRSHC